jgi:HEPN domain-containing protein
LAKLLTKEEYFMNDIIREWILKAEEDWRVANREFEVDIEPAFSIVCYHLQQCAEKYMKAIILSHNQRPEFTHDLIKLSSKLTDLKVEFNFDNEKLFFLNSGGSQYRYPGDSADFEDADYCLHICSEIREVLRKELIS